MSVLDVAGTSDTCAVGHGTGFGHRHRLLVVVSTGWVLDCEQPRWPQRDPASVSTNASTKRCVVTLVSPARSSRSGQVSARNRHPARTRLRRSRLRSWPRWRAERTTHRAGWALPDPTKVVVDPDAWVSAVTNPFGVPARVVEAVITGEIVAVVTQHLLDELAAVLIRPKFRRWLIVADAVSFVETMGGYADLYPDLGARTRRVRDPDDDYLVALAEASAAVIVTGDADLLDADLQPPAITPRDLLTRIR